MRIGMKWFRSNVRYGARAALFALAVQLGLSFGHFHPIAAQAAPSLQSTQQLPPPSHDSDQHPDDVLRDLRRCRPGEYGHGGGAAGTSDAASFRTHASSAARCNVRLAALCARGLSITRSSCRLKSTDLNASRRTQRSRPVPREKKQSVRRKRRQALPNSRNRDALAALLAIQDNASSKTSIYQTVSLAAGIGLAA